MVRHWLLLWYGRLRMVLPDHHPLPELTHLPIEMQVEAAEAMGLYTSTPKTKVRLVERIMGCHHAFVVQLWWY